MEPKQLTADTFKNYPPEGRALALANLTLLQGLPLGFVPFLLKDAIIFDWKFPVEQLELTNQFKYLTELRERQSKREMEPFEGLKLNEKLEALDWVNQPAQFSGTAFGSLVGNAANGWVSGSVRNYVRRFNV